MDTADLHLHSRHSDGEWSPGKLVREAKREGLRAIALTDHDTVSGLDEALRAGEEHGVEVLVGIEISAWNGADFHLLGYGFDPGNPALGWLLEHSRKARYTRAVRMVERLVDLGKSITIEGVLQEAGEGAIGRPHVARALLKGGQIGSIREAFDVYLGDGKPACVDKFRVTPVEAIELLHQAGGVAVAAHPGGYGSPESLDPLVLAGLDGVEADHGMHGTSAVKAFTEYAKEHGLVRTGGSDFHGPRLGSAGVGSVRIPYERVEELRERIIRRREEEGRRPAGDPIARPQGFPSSPGSG